MRLRRCHGHDRRSLVVPTAFASAQQYSTQWQRCISHHCNRTATRAGAIVVCSCHIAHPTSANGVPGVECDVVLHVVDHIVRRCRCAGRQAAQHFVVPRAESEFRRFAPHESGKTLVANHHRQRERARPPIERLAQLQFGIRQRQCKCQWKCESHCWCGGGCR